MRLILGHGAIYEPPLGIRCSAVPTERWFHEPFVSVDMCEETRPHVVWDLRKYPWPFRDGAFEEVVDTCGVGLVLEARTERFQREVLRVLADGGTFHGCPWQGPGVTLTKPIST